jgi:transglutaminase-like putative cysteine protease
MSESAVERILLITAVILLVEPIWWGVFISFYVLLEITYAGGSLISRKIFIIGAQTVVTVVLLIFFHDIRELLIVSDEEGQKTYLAAIGIIASISLVTYLMLLVLSRIRILMAIMVIALDACLIVRYCYDYAMNKVVVALSLILTFAEILRVTYLIRSKNTDNSVLKYLDFRWLPFFVIMEAVIFAIPTIEKPIDWSFVYRIGYRISDSFETLSENTGYFFSGFGSSDKYQSGYNGLSVVTGDLGDSSREELYVTTQGTKDNLYITGNISGSIEDNSDDLQGRWFLDFLYLLYSHDIDLDTARCFARTEKATMEFGYLRTKDIIRPENVLQISYQKDDEITEDGTKFKRTHKKGDSYETIYLNVDYGSRYLEDIIRNSVFVEYPSYEEMQEYCSETLLLRLDQTITKEEYDKWTKDKRKFEEYLDTTEFKTERMEELAGKITANTENEYDAVRAIEMYLRQYRYERYNLKEAGENYVDQFLFETGEGYCVHFANAMVMLLRLNGIPARTVEGYSYFFPNRNQERFVVTGGMAHAWVEAYIDGAGWIPFEPTPSRLTSIDTGWNYVLPEKEEISETNKASSEDSFYPYIPDIPEEIAESEIQETEVEEKSKVDIRPVIRISLMILAGLFAYMLLFAAVILLIRIKRYKHASVSEKLNLNVKEIVWLLNRMISGKEIKTRVLEDYISLLPQDEEVPINIMSEHVFEAYYRQRFSDNKVEREELEEAEKLRKYLVNKELQNHMKKLNGFGKKFRKLCNNNG